MSVFFKTVFERDNHRCVYCGRDLMVDFEIFMTTVEDHLIPSSKEGPNEADNIVTACTVCNNLKGNYVPDDEYEPDKRVKYIEDVREHIMKRRAKRMADFATWTHPVATIDTVASPTS